MGPEGNIFVNSHISTFQQGLTHSAMIGVKLSSLSSSLRFLSSSSSSFSFLCPSSSLRRLSSWACCFPLHFFLFAVLIFILSLSSFSFISTSPSSFLCWVSSRARRFPLCDSCLPPQSHFNFHLQPHSQSPSSSLRWVPNWARFAVLIFIISSPSSKTKQ